MAGITYLHTNLVARDWRALARFYEEVFGCVTVPPERDLRGPSIDQGTAVPGAHIRGIHLRLPGVGDAGPTLEIFQYDPQHATTTDPAVNRPGFGHLAFRVPSIETTRAEVLVRGGSPIGAIVTTRVSDTLAITWCYVRDPEGNILELQSTTATSA